MYCESSNGNSGKEEKTSSFFIEKKILDNSYVEVCFCKEVILSLRQSSVKDVLPFSDRFSLAVVTVKMSIMALCAELTGEHQPCEHPQTGV